MHAGEYVAANSALEEVYDVLRNSYSDVIDGDKRNDSGDGGKNYSNDVDDVWRILDRFHLQSSTSSCGGTGRKHRLL